MAKLSIDRRAADNKYFHRDFHILMDQGLAYLGGRFGDNAVRAYLGTFAKTFYAPLIAEARTGGFQAMRKHIEKTYEIEEVPEAVRFVETDNELCAIVSACPAVAFMKSVGQTPSKWYVQATSTVNEAIADELGWGFEMIAYDEATGAAEYRFFRR